MQFNSPQLSQPQIRAPSAPKFLFITPELRVKSSLIYDASFVGVSPGIEYPLNKPNQVQPNILPQTAVSGSPSKAKLQTKPILPNTKAKARIE